MSHCRPAKDRRSRSTARRGRVRNGRRAGRSAQLTLSVGPEREQPPAVRAPAHLGELRGTARQLDRLCPSPREPGALADGERIEPSRGLVPPLEREEAAVRGPRAASPGPQRRGAARPWWSPRSRSLPHGRVGAAAAKRIRPSRARLGHPGLDGAWTAPASRARRRARAPVGARHPARARSARRRATRLPCSPSGLQPAGRAFRDGHDADRPFRSEHVGLDEAQESRLPGQEAVDLEPPAKPAGISISAGSPPVTGTWKSRYFPWRFAT